MAGTPRRRRKSLYVAARNAASGRAQLIHRVADEGEAKTACGAVLERWSLEYTRTPIEMLLCRRPACRSTHTAANRTTEPGAIVILADRRRARRAS